MTVVAISGILHISSALPVANQNSGSTSDKTGEILVFESESQMEEYMKKTFPELLKSTVNPDELLMERASNVTGIEILPLSHSQHTQGMPTCKFAIVKIYNYNLYLNFCVIYYERLINLSPNSKTYNDFNNLLSHRSERNSYKNSP